MIHMLNRLSTQVGILFFLGTGLIVGSIYWFEYQQELELLPKMAENEAMMSTQLIASGIHYDVRYQKTFQIWKQMNQVQQRYRANDRMTMSEFAVLDSKKELLSHSHPDEHPIMTHMIIPAVGLHWNNNSLQVVQEIYHPSDRSVIGYIALTFDVQSIAKELAATKRQSIISLLFALLVSILLARGLSYRVSAPLRKISTLAARIGDGDIELSVFSNQAQEIKSLASAMYKADQTICEKNAALVESQSLLKSILDYSPALVFIKDTSGRYILINERYEQLLKIKKEEIIGKTDADIFDVKLAKRLRKQDLKIIADAKAYTQEENVSDERGERHYISLKFPLFDAEGNVESVCGIVTDVTEQKKANEEILRLAAVVEQADELVILTDKNGVIEYVNKAFEQVSGYSSLEAIGQKPSIVKSGKHSEKYYSAMWEALHAGKIWRGDFTNKRKGGSYYEVTQSITPIKNEAGQITGFSSVQRDVTHMRQVQQKLQHTDRVESLGVLAGGIAHDFNNLLTAILGNAALALRNVDENSSATKYLGSIETASHSAADLCRQMLAYSGKGKFVVEAINLSNLVESMGKLIEVSTEKNVVIKYHLTEQIPAIDVDIAQIKQVVLNLITNASEAIEHKSGVVSISTGVMQVDETYLNKCIAGEGLEPGRFVYLEVSDTGSGMTKDTQAKIFDPFFTTKFTGRGLGMSAMLGIVKGHHGGLRIYSEVGHGTTIKVVFPISSNTPNVQNNEPSQVSVWQSSGTILVVDDEESLREVASSILEDIGFDVITAKDGLEGVEAYKKHHDKIKLVILDMTMPKMNGQDCFRELRNINSDVRVLLSSGYNEQDATSRFTGKGLAGFIQKPYSPKALEEKLNALL